MDNVWQLIGLGAVAGVFPIYLGIGLALLVAKGINRSLEGYLTGIATGVLVYLFFDLMHEAIEQTGATDPLSWAAFLGSLLIGYVGLVLIEQRQQGRHRTEPAKLFLPYMIALGMGLHNLGEGLAIGAAYIQGEWVLGGLLIMGFALHNGTEGFAIIGSAGTSNCRFLLLHHHVFCFGGRVTALCDLFPHHHFLHSLPPRPIFLWSVYRH
jgi:ZIP family zinc transporter